MLILLIVFMPFAGAFLAAAAGRGEAAGTDAGMAVGTAPEAVSGTAAKTVAKAKNPGERRDRVTAAVTGLELVLTLLLLLWPSSNFTIPGVLVSGLSFRADGFRIVYAIVASFMWFFTTLFSREYFLHERRHQNRWWFFVLLTLGATEGVMLSGDLMTAFLFFEILSFTSFTWVIHEETAEAIRAGYTYLFIAVIGGLILFMGLVLLRHACGTLSFSELSEAVRRTGVTREIFAAGVCILLGFGAKAGMFPLHIWLPRAHPVAPSPGSALLSGILTKVGVYGILMTTLSVFAAEARFGGLVLVLGEITMLLGALLALFSVNLKRTLACSSMSQIGFILTGIGMNVLLEAAGGEGAETALSGAVLHMVNHSFIKLTLFMAAGVVVMRLHALTLDEIRGWGRNKTALKLSFALGALGISGVPLFNGYISKTLLHEGIVEGIHKCAGIAGPLRAAEWVFLISGGFTFAYMLKLFIAVFVEKNADAARQAAFDADRYAMNRLSSAVVGGSSLLMLVLGQPAVMTRLAAFMTGNDEILGFRAFTPENLRGGLISLGIGALVYLVIVRRALYREGSYVNLWPERLDLEDAVCRPLLTGLLPAALGRFAAVFGENRLLTSLAKAVLFAGTFVGRILSVSTDAIVVLLRKTIVREKKIAPPKTQSPGLWWTVREGTSETIESVAQNFSFALLMTCIGILLILGVLVLMSVLRLDLF